MSPVPPEPPPRLRRHGAGRFRALAWRARDAQLSGHGLLGLGVSLTALGSAVLLWGGLTHGLVRGVLLLIAAVAIRGRLLSSRLSAMMPADGLASNPTPGATRRWLSLWLSAVFMMAAGFSAFGSHLDYGPFAGLVPAVLLLLVGVKRKLHHAGQLFWKPHPTTLLALACLVAMVEPLWGWRGQSLVIGLCAVAAVLALQLLLPTGRRPAAA